MQIAILGFDGCLPSAIVGLSDMFWLARQALAQRELPATRTSVRAPAPVHFEVATVSVDGKPLRDGRGRGLRVDAGLADMPGCAAVLVPGLVGTPAGLPLQTPAIRVAGAFLRHQHAHGALVGGSCAGVFVLGESGLLDGRRCTTTWWLHHELKHRYPRSQAVWGSALLNDSRVVTAGGPLSWVDMALHAIGHLAGPEAARMAADFAVIDHTPLSQALYAPHGFVNARDPLLLHAEQQVRNAAPGLTAAQLAQALGTSTRTLHRRLKALVGEAPKAFITRIRIETACTLLQAPGASVKRVGQQTGYDDEASFRRVFKQHIGMSPGQYRGWAKTRRAVQPA